jgi:hypothetical protein
MENRFKERKMIVQEEEYPENEFERTRDRDKESYKNKDREEELDDQPKLSFWNTLFSSDLLPKEKALSLLPYFLFLAFLGVLYIANRHNAEAKTIRWTEGEKEVKELKWEYIGLQSQWMLATKQSQVALSARNLGLKESIVSPYIIEVEK